MTKNWLVDESRLVANELVSLSDKLEPVDHHVVGRFLIHRFVRLCLNKQLCQIQHLRPLPHIAALLPCVARMRACLSGTTVGPENGWESDCVAVWSVDSWGPRKKYYRWDLDPPQWRGTSGDLYSTTLWAMEASNLRARMTRPKAYTRGVHTAAMRAKTTIAVVT